MQIQSKAVLGCAALAVALLVPATLPAQSKGKQFDPPRLSDGKPDLNGIWNGPASINNDIQGAKINGKNIKNALLIDETLDAATPFEGSLYVRKIFPHSVLLAEPGGTTHADSLSGDICVDSTIANYLAYGKLPKRDNHAKWDKTCKPLPRPVAPKHLSANATPRMSPSIARMLPAELLAH